MGMGALSRHAACSRDYKGSGMADSITDALTLMRVTLRRRRVGL